MVSKLRPLFSLANLVPDLLFPTIPAAAGRRAAMIPVLGTLIACWGVGFLRFGKSMTAVFVATLLLALGISLLVGLRAVAQAVATRTAPLTKDPLGELGPLLVLALPIGIVVLVLAGLGVMTIMTGGTIDSQTSAITGGAIAHIGPPLNFPAQIGIWLWLAHEVYCWHWFHRRKVQTLSTQATQSTG